MEDPGDALVTAMLRSLSSIKRLSRQINTKDLSHITKIIEDLYITAMEDWRENKDFDKLRMAESNLRKNYLRLIFESSSRYGNTIFKRYQDSTGDMDPLNMLFNIAGALMRAFAEEYYPLPISTENIGKDRGYISQKHAFVTITHPNIPSLDLIDMTRAHLWFLCHHLFIYRVNSYTATRYLLTLLFKFKPYIDYIYAGGGQGRKSVEKKYLSILDMDRDLYDVIRLAKYDREINHAMHRVTQLELPDTNNKLFNQIKDEIDDPQINDKFYMRVVELFEIENKKIGTIRHQEIMSGLPHPYSLRDVVFNGDKYVQNNSGYLVAAELPILNKKSAKIDFVIFKRILRKNRYLWIPVIILDLKTKTNGVFDFESKPVRGRPELKQPKPVIKLKPVDDWHSTVSNAMNSSASNQLNSYSHMLVNEMQGLLREVQYAPLQAVVAVRVENRNLRDKIHNLLYSLPNYIKDNYKELAGRYIYPEDEEIAVVFKDFHNIELLRKNYKIGEKTPYIPQLSGENSKNKNVTLYTTAASNINFGKTAANIAAVYDCIKTAVEDHGEIIVLDTLDVYSDFTRERMRLPNEVLDLVKIIPLNMSDPDIDMLKQIRKPVVITGWADCKTMITRPWEREQLILENLNTDHIYLIDRAVKDINTSKIYKDRCILPYREYSQRKKYITNIIYNLPVPPKKSKKPLYDDVRVIIRDIREDVEINICPTLTGIVRKFDKTDRRKKYDESRNLSRIKLEEVYDLIAHIRADYLFNTLTLDYNKLGKKEETIRLYHLPFVDEEKKDINREFRSRNSFKRINKMYQRTYRVPYSNEFGKRTLVVEAIDDVMSFMSNREDFRYIVEDFDNNIPQSMILAESSLGINLMPVIEEYRYNFYKTYCGLDMNYDNFERNTNWYNLLFLALRARYPLRDNHLIQLWKQFSTWMLFTLGYEMISNIKYMFNIANIWKQLESRSLYYLSLDKEVIRDEEQGVIEIGTKYSIIRFEDAMGMFEFTDYDELSEMSWQISHPDVTLANFELIDIIPICSGYLGSERYLWLKNDWSEVRKLKMRVDELKRWNIRNIQLIPCNIEELPSVDPYISETQTLQITYVGIQLGYEGGIELTIYSKKSGDISKQVYKVFDSVEELMGVMSQLWGSISQPLEFEGYHCKVEYKYDIQWDIFALLSNYLGKVDVPFTLEDFLFVNEMEKFHVSCNLTHNEEICEKGHPNCWVWMSDDDEELDYYLSDYTSPERIKEIYDRKIIELEDIDRIYYLNYTFDDNKIIYQENEIIKSILSRHSIKKHLLLEYKSYEKEVTKTLVDIFHDVKNHQVVSKFINNITKEIDRELISYFANNKSEQMQAVLDIIDRFGYRDEVFPDDIVKGLQEECERYLEKHPITASDEYEAMGDGKVVSDFECEEIEEAQYRLQLKIDDEWHYYPKVDSDNLLSKDLVIHIIDLIMKRIKSEDTSTNDIVSNLIDYFIETDLSDYNIIADGAIINIYVKLTELKVELLSSTNENLLK